MKQIFAVLLALLVLFAFVGCGDDEQENAQADGTVNGGTTDGANDGGNDSDGGFIFPGSGIPGGITLPEDTFD